LTLQGGLKIKPHCYVTLLSTESIFCTVGNEPVAKQSSKIQNMQAKIEPENDFWKIKFASLDPALLSEF